MHLAGLPSEKTKPPVRGRGGFMEGLFIKAPNSFRAEELEESRAEPKETGNPEDALVDERSSLAAFAGFI